MWDTRPVRRRDRGTVAGVCEGIGDRYRIDPTLVKVAFVVATVFGGSGVLLYLAAAVALPAHDKVNPNQHRAHLAAGGHSRGHAGRRRGGPPAPKWIALIVLAVIAMSTIGSQNTWGSSGLLGVLLMAVGWWLLYQRTPVPPAGTSASSPDDSPEAGATSTILMPTPKVPAGSVAADDVAADATTVGMAADATPSADAPAAEPDSLDDLLPPTPPSWDPLGTARFAWDLPEPTAPPQPPTPRVPRSPLTPIVAGLAVMVGAAGTAGHLAGVDWFTPGRIASLVLATFGVGLIVASMQRRPTGGVSTGLLPLAGLAAAAVLATTLVTGSGQIMPSGGVGDRSWHPPSAADLQDDYHLTVGSSTLDLRDVGDLDRDRTVTVRQGVGEIKVLLPDDLRVRTECTAAVGEVKCADGMVNPDAETPVLTIDAHTTLGEVEIVR